MKVGSVKGWFTLNMEKIVINEIKIKQLTHDSVSFEIPKFIAGYLAKGTGEDLKLTIQPATNSRTLSQNSLLWALIGEIDEILNGRRSKDGEDAIYRNLIEMARIDTSLFKVAPEAFDEIKKRNVFRLVEPLEYEDGFVLIRCYYGSSKFTTKEMKDFIEATLDFATELEMDLEAYKYLRR